METRFSKEILQVLHLAKEEALRTGWSFVVPDHLILGILRHGNNDACRALDKNNIDRKQLKNDIDKAVFKKDALPYRDPESIRTSEEAMMLMNFGLMEAHTSNSELLTSAHILKASFRLSNCICSARLTKLGLCAADFAADPRESRPPKEQNPKFQADLAAALETQLRSIAAAQGATGKSKIFS